MYSKQNTNRQKQNKVSKTIFTARSERSDVEIQKHFIPSARNRDEINTGVDSFPIIGDIESNVEVSVNIDKPNKKTKKSFVVDNPTEISLDVIFPNEIDTNIEFFNSNNNNDIQIDTCTSLNKKVEDINKQLADLEKDIQFNFYDPKTKVGSNLKKYSSHLQSFSSSKNVSKSNTTSTASEYGNFNNKFNNAPKQSDASIELKNEIYNYRSSLKQKDFEEKIEKRLEKLHKQKEQSELRKNNETKVESGHEPTCPLSLKIDLPESVLKIHEMQLTAKRVKIAEGSAPNNTQNATSSQTSLQKDDQTTIQNKEQEPSTSKSNDIITPSDLQQSISSVNVDVVRQLDTLLTKSTNELDELKSLLKEYLETEKANKSPRADKNVKFQIEDTARPKGKDAINKKKIKQPPSRSSSNSDISLSSSNVKSRKKVPREPQCRQIMDIEKKSKVIKIKQVSKNTKTTKCDLSDISESNEMQRNSSSSDIIKSKPVIPSKKQSKKGTSTSKPLVTYDKQKEFILNIVSKSNSSCSLSSSDDEDKRTHIHDFIGKPPKDSNDLTNPPNTVRSVRLALPENNEPQKVIDKKSFLRVQILPALDIRRSLTTQKLPDVAIESTDGNDIVNTNKMSSENIKYIKILHHSDKDLPKEEPKAKSPSKPATPDIKIKEIFIAKHEISSSSDASVLNEVPPTQTQIHDKESKIIPKQRGTVSEELNLDIESLPSVRTLKEIQSYLEQKCALIRERLQEESKLKTGETLSLRYKLCEPPLWQSSNSKAEPENETITIVPEQKPLSPLKTYSTVKTPLSPLQKRDKSQQVKNNRSLRNFTNIFKNNVDKASQVSVMEFIGLPYGRDDNICSPAKYSIQSSKKDIHGTKDDFNTPPLSLAKTTSIREITPEKNVSTQTDYLKVVCCVPRNTQEINTELVSHENQVTNKPLTDTDIKTFSDTSTQINEFNYVTPQPAKHVSFKTVTKQFSILPSETKETQISPLDFKDEMTKIPKVIKKDEKTQTATINNETIIKEKAAPIVRNVQTNATQTVKHVQDKFTICNIKETTNEKEIVQIKAPPVCKETKECCTQCSPVPHELLDTTEYKHINSFRKIENEEPSKRVHYPQDQEERRCYYKSKMRHKRTAPERHKICSTPVSASSSSISTAETLSFSDGEVKLSCECSTSIGEIHLCRFANDIRKKVRILKQNPKEVLKESFGGSNFKMQRQHKYNENWFAYYVTKTESSSEQGTGSNLSSIKSNIETE